MKVIVSCGGKFHAFNLAEQLDKKGYLEKLITSYYSQKAPFFPKFRKDKEKVNLEKVVSNMFPHVLGKINSKFKLIQAIPNLDYHLLNIFDSWAKTQIVPCDIFVGWSGYSLKSLRKAKQFGAITIIERCSSHIQFQREILEEEYKMFDYNVNPVNELTLQKELLEYDEADYISIPSRFVKETFLEKGLNPSKLIHVSYGVDTSNFKQVQKEDDKFRIIYLGALSLRKGIPYLLKAYSELNLPNSELHLIGAISPEIVDTLKKYEGSFKHEGFIPHLDLYKYLSQGSVFVLPSIEEGLAYVILQAMACGLPVICTENTGGADVIRDGKEGFILPIRDVGKLKEKILYLYEHENKRKTMSEMALKRVGEFTWDVYGEKMISLYDKLISM